MLVIYLIEQRANYLAERYDGEHVRAQCTPVDDEHSQTSEYVTQNDPTTINLLTPSELGISTRFDI